MTARVTITIEGDALDVLHALAGLVDQTRLETSDVTADRDRSDPGSRRPGDVEEAAAPEEPATSGADANPLTCPECGRGFKAPTGLGRHRQAVHGIAGSSASAATKAARRSHDAEPTPEPEPVADEEPPAPAPVFTAGPIERHPFDPDRARRAASRGRDMTAVLVVLAIWALLVLLTWNPGDRP